VYYGHDGEAGIGVLLDAFKKDFPKIKTSYVRLQTGALYAKITAERSAGRFGVDVLQLSDVSPAIDFQKKGGWEQYASPEYAAYKPEYQSTPAGFYGVPGIGFAGICYNRSKVKAEQAPKTWKDILNPVYKDGISAKLATSGSWRRPMACRRSRSKSAWSTRRRTPRRPSSSWTGPCRGADRPYTRTRRSCSMAQCGPTRDRCPPASACPTSSSSSRRTGTTMSPAIRCS